MAIEDNGVAAANYENESTALEISEENDVYLNAPLTEDLCEENDCVDLTKPFDFADVTFLVEDKPIYYNRSMLAMHSPHFKRLFYGAKAVHDKEIRLKDKKFDGILTMLKLLKLDPDSSERLITDENLEDLLKLAEEYQLRHVTAVCEKCLLLKWKFSSAKIVKAFEIAAKFGLHSALNDLLVKPSEDYPPLLTDTNVELLLRIAKEYQLANIMDLCEKYLLLNWKHSGDKMVRAVELAAKFGLEKALANLLKATDGLQSNITDDNIEQLLSLCKGYSLFEIRADFESYIMKNWINNTEKALRAVEIAHEVDLPNLATAFIPLAACRPLAEIERSEEKLSEELFAHVLHAALVKKEAWIARQRNVMDVAANAAVVTLMIGMVVFLAYAAVLFDLRNVTFVVEQKGITVNRDSLASHSPHFKRLFYGANASSANLISLEDNKFDDVRAMFQLLNLTKSSNEQLITDANVEELLKLAKEYQLSHVKAECEKFLLSKWKFSKSKIVKAMELSAEFGLSSVVKGLLVKPADYSPAILTDENVEQVLSIAKKYRLADIIVLCQTHLLQNWKNSADKVVRAVELSAKFGLEKPLADLRSGGRSVVSLITDDNVDQLRRLGKEYNLVDILTACETHTVLKSVILEVENQTIVVNRGMLATHSPHFKRLFYGTDASHATAIRLENKKFDDVLTMLKLFNLTASSNEQLITDANVEDLLNLAEEYQLRRITAECEKFLLSKWKFHKSRFVKVMQLSAKFGLSSVLKDLLYYFPALLTDENVEQFLSIAKQYRLVDIIDLCETHLLQNWKHAEDKVVRAVELSAKFGLEKPLADLRKAAGSMHSLVTEGNVYQLWRLGRKYKLVEILIACILFVF